jgi:hypothetical protein
MLSMICCFAGIVTELLSIVRIVKNLICIINSIRVLGRSSIVECLHYNSNVSSRIDKIGPFMSMSKISRDVSVLGSYFVAWSALEGLPRSIICHAVEERRCRYS